VVEQLRSSVASLTARVSTLEKGCSLASSGPTTQPAVPASSAPAKKETEANEDDDEDDFELFGSDDEVIFISFVRFEVFGTQVSFSRHLELYSLPLSVEEFKFLFCSTVKKDVKKCEFLFLQKQLSSLSVVAIGMLGTSLRDKYIFYSQPTADWEFLRLESRFQNSIYTVMSEFWS